MDRRNRERDPRERLRYDVAINKALIEIARAQRDDGR
jgi:hypothetical protein